MIYSIWFTLLIAFGLMTWLAHKKAVMPIIIQLSLCLLFLPIIVYIVLPYYALNVQVFLAPEIKVFYTLNFAVLFAYILSDAVDLKPNKEVLLISLPSFLLPFMTGVALATYLNQTWQAVVSIGLVFAITAVPVLFIFLKNFNYNHQRSKILLQVALVIDIASWSIFSLLKSNTHLLAIGGVFLLGLSALILNKFSAKIQSTIYFVSIILLEYFKLNSMIFGITFILCMSIRAQAFILPISMKKFEIYQNYLAIPVILIFGMIQINYSAFAMHSILLFITLIVLPIITKILGNYMGLRLSGHNKKVAYREAFLLNTRGLTEIVFLNMLFSQSILNNEFYMGFMLMGLISTILPLVIFKKPVQKKLSQNQDVVVSKG